MMMRAQAMFFAAFVIACAMCLASLAAAHGQAASSGATANATLSKAHQSALKHAHALSSYLRGRDVAQKEVVLGHSEAIGSALQEAAQVSTSLATEVRAADAKDQVESMREHQADAAAQHKKLTDELTLVPLDAEAIRAIAREIVEEVRQAQRANLKVASIERGLRKQTVPVE
jgi:protein-disulfide isomerase-like protein with CxxC motif